MRHFFDPHSTVVMVVGYLLVLAIQGFDVEQWQQEMIVLLVFISGTFNLRERWPRRACYTLCAVNMIWSVCWACTNRLPAIYS